MLLFCFDHQSKCLTFNVFGLWPSIKMSYFQRIWGVFLEELTFIEERDMYILDYIKMAWFYKDKNITVNSWKDFVNYFDRSNYLSRLFPIKNDFSKAINSIVCRWLLLLSFWIYWSLLCDNIPNTWLCLSSGGICLLFNSFLLLYSWIVKNM